MSPQPPKIQIGIRLPQHVVDLVDAQRQTRTRSDFCRELIEIGLSATRNETNIAFEGIGQEIQALQEQLCEIRQAAVLAEREAEKAATEITGLRVDLATAIVGVLTKIGHVVRDEDQRHFAREKAETFVRRVLLSQNAGQEE